MISVIIPVHVIDDHLVRLTEKCFRSLTLIDQLDQVTVIDNASTREYETEDWFRVIKNSENKGYAKAVNQGAEKSYYRFFLILNNDCELQDGAVDELLKNMEDERVGVSTACPVGSQGPQGCCWMISRNLFKEVGPMDEQFEFGAFEDTDYWRRIEERGLEVRVVKEAIVKHQGRQTFSRLPKHEEIFKRNKERFEAKWGCLS